MWRPGKSSIPLVAETNQQLDRAPPDRQTGSKKRAAGGDASPVGLRPPFDPSPPELSHPDCRWLRTLIRSNDPGGSARPHDVLSSCTAMDPSPPGGDLAAPPANRPPIRSASDD